MLNSKWLLTSLALVLIPATAMAAASDSEGVAINGSVADTCTLGVPSQTAANNGALNAGATNAAAEIEFTSLADAATALYTGGGSSVTITMAGMCNYASNLAVMSTAGSLVNTSGVSVVAGSLPFVDKIYYTAGANWGGQSTSVGAFDVPGIKNNTPISGALLDDIDLTVTLFGTNNSGV